MKTNKMTAFFVKAYSGITFDIHIFYFVYFLKIFSVFDAFSLAAAIDVH